MVERVLIVDDDPVQRRLIENIVGKAGYETASVDGGEAALKAMLATESTYDCIVLDLVMPELDGLGVLGRMREAGLEIPVIVQTAHGGIDSVVTAMRAGAVDFVVKPVSFERLSVSLRNAMAARALAGEIARQKRSRSGTLTFRDIITRSPKMHAVLRVAQKASSSAIPVLIEGESGVGKELIARAIHGSGERRTKSFVAVNCGALPENLVESLLFGHERGAFTGAAERHDGKFVEASGGTLFLDEVGELPPAAQVKLLRVIQDGEVHPVGGKKPIKVNTRIISATNRDLTSDVKSGRFREDLFYRLHVFPIAVPSLRDRAEDIPELTRHFLVRFAAEEGKRIQSMSAEALNMLALFHWPGNVRQLENAIFRAVVLADGEELTSREFPQIAAKIGDSNAGPRRITTQMHVTLAPSDDTDAQLLCQPNMGRAATEVQLRPGDDAGPGYSLISAAPSGSRSMLNLFNADGDVRSLEDIEAEVIRFSLIYYNGRMSEVARRLRIGRSTLYRKLEVLGCGMADNTNA
ncbi:MAG TPA: sigma-54 dependent transcriptional regulator [Xanthobacteraceae bacterium]|nr:sigma-54 dependent transcriptional regulator [Xanthobacteraceae bacterium]